MPTLIQSLPELERTALARQYDVFISYAREDGGDFASYLAYKLQKSGLTVFLDEELLVGESLVEVFDKSIESAKLVILLLSRAATTSKWVEKEVASAVRRNKHVLPVILDRAAIDSPVYSIVSDRQYIDGTEMSPQELAGRITRQSPLAELMMDRTFNKYGLSQRKLAFVLASSVLLAGIGASLLFQEDKDVAPNPGSRGEILRLAETYRDDGGAQRAILDGIVLPDVDLSNLDFSGTRMRRAVLVRANLTGVNFTEADLTLAILALTDSTGVDFFAANLTKADLRLALLIGANLQDANLQDANSSGANLQDANLQDANFSGANLRDANLKGANLNGANLNDANLHGADLTNVYLNRTFLSGALFDAYTTFPQEFVPIDMGMVEDRSDE